MVVHPANLQDRDGATLVLAGTHDQFPRIQRLWGDQGQAGQVATWITQTLGWTVTSVPQRPKSRGHWVPHGDLSDWRTVWFAYVRFPASHTGFRGGLPRRWVVERTIAWIGRNRRMSKDDEDPLATSEAGGSLSMVRVMLIKRLAREQVEPEFHSRRAA